MITPRRFAASCSPALLTLLVSACSIPPAPPMPESLDELAKQSLAQIEGELKVKFPEVSDVIIHIEPHAGRQSPPTNENDNERNEDDKRGG